MKPAEELAGALAEEHLVGSVYMRKAMPGVYSAPLMLGAALFLLASVP